VHADRASQDVPVDATSTGLRSNDARA
jgi:hypothetical protein